ncbi:MAG TPA: helix-turn-helix transcriptional regulator [Streptosporangiaceae bacterium]|nr:helix-turn-helix transcriptional regulator [Streptosporangiaceae bacterium]
MYVPLSGLQEAVRLVGGLTDLDDPAGFADVTLPHLAQLIGCDSLSYSEIGPGPDRLTVSAYPRDLVSPETLARFAALVHEHPLIGRCQRTSDERPIKISDFLSQPRFHCLGLYAEVFRHLRIEYQMAFSLPSPRGQVIGIAFNRARSDFSEDDRALLNVLRCPLSTALERARERQRARECLATASLSVLGGLTDREIDVLRLAALGRTNTAIAHALDVSPRTVAKHLQHIYRKLNVTSRASAVFTALAS